VLENPLPKKKTAQNGPESIPDQPKKYQPKTVSTPIKEQKPGRKETHVALSPHHRNQSHKNAH
jgi:hypothetical protein